MKPETMETVAKTITPAQMKDLMQGKSIVIWVAPNRQVIINYAKDKLTRMV
ncbi:MAG: hypothetical protein PVI03_01260 [Candidatus Thorarchaeota archaeon]|jgi:hypothetical protein